MHSPTARLEHWRARASTTRAVALLTLGALAIAAAAPLALAWLLSQLAGDAGGHQLEPLLGIGAITAIGATILVVGVPTVWALTGIIKRRVKTEAQLLETTLAGIPAGIALYDAGERLQLLNPTYARLLEAAADFPALGQRCPAGGQPLDSRIGADAARAPAEGAVASVAPSVDDRLRQPRPPGSRIEQGLPDGSWWQVDEHPTAAGGRVRVASDITLVKQRESALRAGEERFRQFAEAASDWFWELDAEQRFSYVSERIRSVLGMDPASMLGHRPDEVVPDIQEQAGWPTFRDAIAARRPFRDYIVRFTAPDNKERHVKLAGVPVLDRDGALLGYRGTGTDITEQTRAEARIQHLAHHDALTGLPNRALFHDRLAQALAQAGRSGGRVAILQIDLDDFKDINDTFGHDAGDFLLCRVAERLGGCIRMSDTVARMGGDEFAIVLTGLRHPTDAGQVAQTIVESLAVPIAFQGHKLCVGASVGVTIYPTDDTEPGRLLRNADVALYQAKENGRGSYSLFVPEMTAEIDRRKRLERDLRLALAHEQFVLLYQPQVSLGDGRLIGFEALLRWQHPERGLLEAAAFIELADQLGLTVPIGELVLRQACLQARAWLDAGLDPGRVAVNVSMAEFHRSDLARTVQGVLNDTRLPPDRLEIEVAEDVLIQRDSERVEQKFAALHQLGLSFALDDFGTGQASLSCLRRFRVDRLKIDRSFVRDIDSDPDDAAIVRAVINLGHSLALEVVAEGVETEAQARFLRRHGCDGAQGYLFARPLAAAAATALLAAAAATALLAQADARLRELLPS